MNEKRALTWDEFIDLDFAYAEPKAESREQSASLWSMQLRANPADWTFFLEGKEAPEPGDTLSSSIDFDTHSITLSFEGTGA